MSRSITMSVECLGTKLEWDCGHSLAEAVVERIGDELQDACLKSQEAGDGYCGTVTYRMEGLTAYYYVCGLATEMFQRRSAAHALMLRDMAEQYEHALHSAQELTFLLGEESLQTNEETAHCIVDKVLKYVEEANVAFGVPAAFAEMKQEGLLGEATTVNELQTVLDTQDWALSLTVSASY